MLPVEKSAKKLLKKQKMDKYVILLMYSIGALEILFLIIIK